MHYIDVDGQQQILINIDDMQVVPMSLDDLSVQPVIDVQQEKLQSVVGIHALKDRFVIISNPNDTIGEPVIKMAGGGSEEDEINVQGIVLDSAIVGDVVLLLVQHDSELEIWTLTYDANITRVCQINMPQ